MGKRLDKAGIRVTARTLHRLTALKVARAKTPGMYADGGSLYLRIAPGGSKQWVFRYALHGRLRDMGLGSVGTFNLSEARERARDARKLLQDGIDPVDSKHARLAGLRADAARSMTFRACAEQFLKEHERKWTSPKHATEWRTSLVRFVYPTIGSLPVAAIDTPLVLKVLKPMWERIPETASRVRGRIEAVLGWATVHHYRSGDNPARWQQHLEHALPAVTKGDHHAALPYAAAPAFMAKLRQDTSVGARCLEFIVLTAARLTEAREATWDEINLSAKTWTVPAARMKAGKEHKVPLSGAALAVLKAMQALRRGDYVFPGFREGRPISPQATLTAQVKALNGDDATIHGFRSSFRDWAAERTNYPREVAEMALAHAIPNAVEAAYRRGDLFEKRRKLMEAWSDFCAKPAAKGEVVAIRGRA
jgi:integrase